MFHSIGEGRGAESAPWPWSLPSAHMLTPRVAWGVEMPPPCGRSGVRLHKGQEPSILESGSPQGSKEWVANGLRFADHSAHWIFSEERQSVCPSQGLDFPSSPSPRRPWHLLYCGTQPPARSARWHCAWQLWGHQCQEGWVSRRSKCPAKENKVTGKGPGEQSWSPW